MKVGEFNCFGVDDVAGFISFASVSAKIKNLEAKAFSLSAYDMPTLTFKDAILEAGKMLNDRKIKNPIAYKEVQIWYIRGDIKKLVGYYTGTEFLVGDHISL